MRLLDNATAELLEPIRLKDGFNDHLKVAVVKKEHKHKNKKGVEHTSHSWKLELTVYSTYQDTDGLTQYGPPRDNIFAYYFFLRFPFKTRRRTKNMEEKYEIPFTDLSVALIEYLWPRTVKQDRPKVGDIIEAKGEKINFEFADDKSRQFYQMKLEAEKVGDRNAQRAAEFKANGEIDFWTNVQSHPDLPPGPHQKAACINSLKSNTALWMEQGTGKTLIGIMKTETEALKKPDWEINPYTVLILCPKNVRTNWKREFKKFGTLQHHTTVVRGTKATDRVSEVIAGILPLDNGDRYKVIVMGYEAFVSVEQYLKNIEWDLVLLDEAHSIANPSTARTQAILRLRKNSKSRIPMTGTPYKNSIMDLYPQLEFLYEGASGATSLKEFRDMHTESERLQSGVTVLTGFKNIPMLQERISRHSFMVTLKEAQPNLPEKTFDVIECSMTHKQAKVYKQIAAELYAELQDELTGETNSITINNVLTQLLRLAQITSGYVVWDAEVNSMGELERDQCEETFDSTPTSSNKMEVLVEELKNKQPWEKTQIWCCFKHNIKKIEARLQLEGIDCVTFYGATSDKKRQEAEDRFNCDPKCKVFIGHPKAGGTGLNLLGYDKNNPDACYVECKELDGNGTLQLVKHNTNCNHVIYYSYNWSYADRSQSAARAYRTGTRVPVRISVMIVPGSIDEEINSRVEAKEFTGAKITDVRDLLAKLVTTNPVENGD